MEQPRKLRVLFLREEDGAGEHWWVAQCVDFDMAAQGRTFADAAYEFERAAMSRIAIASELGVDPFAGLPKAPPEIEEAFEKVAQRGGGATRVLQPWNDGLLADVPPAFQIQRQYEVGIGD